MYTKSVGRRPEGWFGGRVMEPTYIFKTEEKGEVKFKMMTNGKFGMKIKRRLQGLQSVYYVWTDITEYYSDVKKQP